ncbi:MAG TPA: tail fiber domain-containing protein [Candidatus Sulfotelmatobacter sp.]
MRVSSGLLVLCLCFSFSLAAAAQQSAVASAVVVPTLVNFNGALRDAAGKPLTGPQQVTFALYNESEGGAALWMETQKVEANATGLYTAMLGSSTSQGMPAALFATGEARWLGVRVQGQEEGQEEQPRVLLVSVPYALKAADAQTLGGMPASAFALAPSTISVAAATGSALGVSAGRHTPVLAVSTTGGTVNTLALFASSSDIEKSVVSQTGSGPTAKIGINATPATTLDVNGDTTVRGNLTSNGFVNATKYEIGGSPWAFGDVNGNIFIGFTGNTTNRGSANTAVGSSALATNTGGVNNTAYGESALFNNTTGYSNTAIGGDALDSNTTGSGNVAVGEVALVNNSSGGNNVAIGSNTLTNVASGSNNTGLGYLAGAHASAAITNATAIGAFSDVTASNSLVLGSINGVNSATADTNVGIGTTTPLARLHIGNSNTTGLRIEGPSTSGTGTLAASFGGFGDFSIDASGVVSGRFVVKENGNVGIGTATPDSRLSVAGSADKTGGGSWGTYSDRRLKDLDGSFVSGLSQVLRINPVRYRYKEENGMGIHDGEEHIGLVAQEVQSVIPEAVTENSKGYLLVNNDPIIWAMLNAIKEQQRQIEEQRRQIRLQQRQITRLSGKVQAVGSAACRTKATSKATAKSTADQLRPTAALESAAKIPTL